MSLAHLYPNPVPLIILVYWTLDSWLGRILQLLLAELLAQWKQRVNWASNTLVQVSKCNKNIGMG